MIIIMGHLTSLLTFTLIIESRRIHFYTYIYVNYVLAKSGGIDILLSIIPKTVFVILYKE